MFIIAFEALHDMRISALFLPLCRFCFIFTVTKKMYLGCSWYVYKIHDLSEIRVNRTEN